MTKRRQRNPKLLSLTNIAIGVGLFYAYKKGWLSKLTDSLSVGPNQQNVPWESLPSVSPDSPGAGYAWCADEGQRCAFTGSRSVAYGARGQWTYKTALDGVNCDNHVFPDPIAGFSKKCFVK